MMNLVIGLGAMGAHVGNWRHRDAWNDTVENFGLIRKAVQIAETGKLDAIFFPRRQRGHPHG